MKSLTLKQNLAEEENFSTYEKVTFLAFITVILFFLSVSFWSYFLLVTGDTECGGPLGYIARKTITFLF